MGTRRTAGNTGRDQGERAEEASARTSTSRSLRPSVDFNVRKCRVRRVGWSTTGASPNSRPIVGSVMPSGDVNLRWPRRDGSACRPAIYRAVVVSAAMNLQ